MRSPAHGAATFGVVCGTHYTPPTIIRRSVGVYPRCRAAWRRPQGAILHRSRRRRGRRRRIVSATAGRCGRLHYSTEVL